MTNQQAQHLKSFTVTDTGWMFVKVSSCDWHRFCANCGRQAHSFVAWMLKPPSSCMCVDCYERWIGTNLKQDHPSAVSKCPLCQELCEPGPVGHLMEVHHRTIDEAMEILNRFLHEPD